MNQKKHYIFQTLDHVPKILYWAVDEFFLIIFPIFFAIACKCFILMLIAFLNIPYTRLKKKLSHRALVHYAYWYLPTAYLQKLGLIKNLPQTCIKEYLL